jgi:enoyl-CoA hydratase/carnithine racemase
MQTPSCPVLTVDGHVATITLNRPAHRNRLHNEDLRALLAHCNAVNQNTAIAVLVLRANTFEQTRPVFCAGFHIGQFDGNEPVVPFEQVPDAIEALRPITICAMGGSVFGGATDLALACDFRIGVQGMTLKMPAAALGLHYYPSGLARYVSRLGLAAAKKAFLRAQPFSDLELLRVGYLDALVSAESLDAEVAAWVKQLLNLAPMALSGMKQSLNDVARSGLNADTLSAIRSREAACAASGDFVEGRLAFEQKRAPLFQGK